MEIEFKGNLPLPKKENKINQGDIVFCKAQLGTMDFWGVCTSYYDGHYKKYMKTIVSFDGGGTSYIIGEQLYLDETYSYWAIVKRIPCEKVKITIEELH